MRRWILLTVLVGAAAAVASAIRSHESGWTTGSSEARAAFEKGLMSLDKVYMDDARRHFARAVEADPGFAAALVFYGRLLDSTQEQPLNAVMANLQAIDPAALTDRERFLVKHFLLMRSGRAEEAWDLVGERLSKDPDDRFALELQANQAFTAGRWEEADRLYNRMVELAPNWVTSYNQLGYSAMSQGRFGEAEKLFLKYRFVSPDQANPHDSLAELLIVLGRYDQAEKELEDALAVKPDFCASYYHLVMLGELSGALDTAHHAIARAENEGECGPEWVIPMRRGLTVWEAATAGDWQAVLDASSDGQTPVGDGITTSLVNHAFLRLGRNADALALEGNLFELAGSPGRKGTPAPGALALLVEGMRLLAEGRPGEAVERCARANAQLSFRGLDHGALKLFTMASLARALGASGDDVASDQMIRSITAVNPSFAIDLLRRLDVTGEPPQARPKPSRPR